MRALGSGFRGMLLLVLVSTACSSYVQSTPNIDSVQQPWRKPVVEVGIVPDDSEHDGATLAYYVENTSNASIKLLVWGTPFENPLFSNIFSVTRGNQKSLYLGRLIKRGLPVANNYVMLKPGEKVHTTIDISKHYDMSLPGAYNVMLDLVEIDGALHINQETPVAVGPKVVTIIMD